MILDSILINQEKQDLWSLRDKIEKFCPQVQILETASSLGETEVLISNKTPQLLFIEQDLVSAEMNYFTKRNQSRGIETIIVSKDNQCAAEVINLNLAGFVCKPIQPEQLILAVYNAGQRIEQKNRMNYDARDMGKSNYISGSNELIGIPTIKGFDFLCIQDILRCEGLQKCTRIITKTASDIISSYNLGEFRKILEPYGFFSPHKSHLINLRQIKCYHKEGTIIMNDSSYVPVSRRKKKEFINNFQHIKPKTDCSRN